MFIDVCVSCHFRVLLLVSYILAVADQSPRLGKREHIFSAFAYLCGFGNEWFPLPLGAWDGLCNFIVTLPWPTI